MMRENDGVSGVAWAPEWVCEMVGEHQAAMVSGQSLEAAILCVGLQMAIHHEVERASEVLKWRECPQEEVKPTDLHRDRLHCRCRNLHQRNRSPRIPRDQNLLRQLKPTGG